MRTPSRILVVDDNPATLYTTRRMLESAGFSVETAQSGCDVLERGKIDCDLIVLDVNLPDIDGFELCRRLRAQPQTGHIPILHLSATFTNQSHEAEGLAAGADGYLTHPVEPLVLVATIRSLLRTRSAEEGMRRSEAKFRAIFDAAPCGIALLDEDFRYSEANPAMCELLGRSRDEIVGEHVLAFVPSERRTDADFVGRPEDSGISWRSAVPLQRGDGSVIDVDWNVTAYPASSYRLVIATDITAREQLAAERERLLASERSARAEAERANRIKDEFLATLSHELRSPLNAIVGWTSVLRRREHDSEFTQGLEAIERNARVQTQLISDLLDVARISSGKIRLEIEPVELRSIIESSIGTVAPAALAKRIEISHPQPGPSLWVQCDPSRLQQVIWNLLSNAVKFTPRGGRVSVELMRTAGPTAELVVRDNGQGIKPEFLPHMFERFRQEDSSKTRSYSGLGLGLSIVKQLTELHGGSVRAHSAGEGKGAAFIVALPVMEHIDVPEPARQRSATEDPFVSSAQQRLDGARVLIVEDDPDTRTLIERVLRDAGAQVAASDTVESALHRLETVVPDLLLSDIGMADQDGYELIRDIRKRGWSAERLPALALTAFARAEDREEALRAGYQEHIAKPVDPHRLVGVIHHLLYAGSRSDE